MDPDVTGVKSVCRIDPAKFLRFCAQVRIPAKEGVIAARGLEELEGEEETGEVLVPLHLIEPQAYLFRELMLGLSDDIHLFWVVKCRQSGTTTLGLAFLSYWCMTHPGMIFSMINPDTDLKETNRSLASSMLESLPEEYALEVSKDNRVVLEFSNKSKIIWLNANAKKDKKSGLGQGIGMLGVHGTELGSWEDEDGVRSLMASLAQRNPNRFYLFEGTAKGPGLFKDYWTGSADDNLEARSIFIGWWLHPMYRLDLNRPKHAQIYREFWECFPRASREEDRWVAQVKESYGYVISPEQLAWWRWMLKKPFKGKLEHLYQEYPPLASYAWNYGGTNYVSGASIHLMGSIAKADSEKARFFQFSYGTKFAETRIREVKARSEFYDLVSWEDPIPDNPFVRYIVALDPAHGANEFSDLAVVEVFRAYSDQLVQVAEFSARGLPPYALAWAILELAGVYHAETRLCLELQGGGYAVNDELQRLKREMAQGYSPALVAHFDRLSMYKYSRMDAATKVGFSYHWITSRKTKEFMLDRYWDHFERGKIVIRSPELILETRDATRDLSGEVKPAREDNRLMAAALAVVAYLQTLDVDIGSDKNFSRAVCAGRESQLARDPEKAPQNFIEQRLNHWKKDLLEKMEEEKEARAFILEMAKESDWRADYESEMNRP